MAQFGNQAMTRKHNPKAPVVSHRECPWWNYKHDAKPCGKCLKRYNCNIKKERMRRG